MDKIKRAVAPAAKAWVAAVVPMLGVLVGDLLDVVADESKTFAAAAVVSLLSAFGVYKVPNKDVRG